MKGVFTPDPDFLSIRNTDRFITESFYRFSLGYKQDFVPLRYIIDTIELPTFVFYIFYAFHRYPRNMR
jgi:hypothetical protein